MSNACVKSIRLPIALPRPLHKSINIAQPARNAFFSRFYSVVTASARPTWHERNNVVQHTSTEEQRRWIHETSADLKKGVPRASPKARSAGRQRSAPPAPKQNPTKSLAPFSDEDLKTVFGTEATPELGNWILQTLHRRRVNGSLIEHGLVIKGVDVPWDALQKALAWLREKYPVDEKATASEWADREAEKLQESYISRAERFNLIRKRSEDEVQQQRESQPRSALSVFDRIRAQNEEKARKQALERIESGEQRRSDELALAKVEARKTERENFEVALAKRKADLAVKGRVTDFEEPPKMTKRERLLPSSVFAALLVAGLVYYAEMYTPPEQASRIWPDLPPSVATITGILTICTLITFLWHIPMFHKTFNTFLLVCPAYPFAFSIVGNVFSHQGFVHLGANMFAVAMYGFSLHEYVGRGNFIAIFCIGGIAGSVLSLYWFVLRNVLITTSCGASGGLWAVMMAWAHVRFTSNEEHKEDGPWQYTFDIARYGILVMQIFSHFVPGAGELIDIASHAGGAVSGLIGALILQERARRRKGKEERSIVAGDA